MNQFALYGLMLFSAITFTACDLFTTRDPEPPTQGSSGFRQPVTPDLVLENLQTAIGEANVDNYVRCLSDSSTSGYPYHFFASADVVAQFTSLFTVWTPDDERDYFRNLGTPQNAAPLLSFTNQRQIATSSDSVVYVMDYQLFYPHRRAGVPTRVQGQMQLSIGSDDQGRWSVNRWQDFKSTSDSTWSYWKAVFSAQ